MADELISRNERVLIEPLESRTLLSAVLLQQPPIVVEAAPATGLAGPVVVTVSHDLAPEQAGVISIGAVAWQPHLSDPRASGQGDWHPSAGSSVEPQSADGLPPHWASESIDRAESVSPSLLRQGASISPRGFSGEDYADLSRWQSASAPEHPLLARPGADAQSTIVVLVAPDGSTETLLLQGGDAGNSRLIFVPEDPGAMPKPDGEHSAHLEPPPPSTAEAQPTASAGPAISHSSSSEQSAGLPTIAAAARTVATPLRVAPVSTPSRIAVEPAVVDRSGSIAAPSASALDAKPLDTPDAIPVMGSISSDRAVALAAVGAQPQAAVGAIRIAVGWIRSAAAAVGQAFDQPGPVIDAPAEALAPAAYNVLRISPAMLFNDTVGRIIREAATVSAPASPDAPTNHTRAWAITGAVVLADAILVTQWQLKRRKQLCLARKRPLQRLFCAARI